MRYDYRCRECSITRELTHSIKESPTVVCECGAIMQRIITGGCGVIYKGEGWSTKSGRVRTQMSKNREKVKQRKGRVGGLVPNYDGETAPSWVQAAEIAREKGADPTPLLAKAVKEGEVT